MTSLQAFKTEIERLRDAAPGDMPFTVWANCSNAAAEGLLSLAEDLQARLKVAETALEHMKHSNSSITRKAAESALSKIR